MTQTNSSYRWWVLGLLFTNVAVAMVSLEVMSPLYLEISGDVPLSRAQFGVVMGIFHLASPFFTPIGGILIDRIGARKVILAAMVIVGTAGASRVLMTSANGMIFAMFLLGVGFASVGPSIPKALSSVFSAKHMGKATGTVTAAFGLGNSFALATGATVLSPAFGGWQPTLLVVGAVCVTAGLVWFSVYRDAESGGEGEVQDTFVDGIKQVLRVRNIWLLALFYCGCMIAYWGLLAHLTPTLTERGIEGAGLYAATLTGTSVLFNIVGGVLSDWVGRKPVLLTCAFVLAACVPGMLELDGAALTAVMVVAGAALGPIIPVSAAMPVEMSGIGRRLAGTGLGFMFMIGNIGSTLGPMILGRAIEASGSLWASYSIPMASLAVATIPMFLLVEKGEAS